jgi:hypothetical protein
MFKTYRLKVFDYKRQISIETGTNPIVDWRGDVQRPELWDAILDPDADTDYDILLYVFAWEEELDSPSILIANTELDRHGFVPVNLDYEMHMDKFDIKI